MKNKLLIIATVHILWTALSVLSVPTPALAQARKPLPNVGPATVPNVGINRGTRYRVVATGFTVVNPTTESQILRDGRGDEAFVAANVVELTAGSSIIGQPTSKRSVTYGDTDGRSTPVTLIPTELARIPRYSIVRAGTAGPNGGLTTNDSYPAGNTIPVEPSDAPASARGRFLPMVLWEGDLRATANRNGVVILPTIWESDNIDSLWTVWNASADSFLRNFARRSSGFVIGTTPHRILEQVDTVMSTVVRQNDYDRPVGLDGDAYNPVSADPGPAYFHSRTFIPDKRKGGGSGRPRRL